MAPAKRSRPAFSPPRPRKSKSKATKSSKPTESNKKRSRPSKTTTTSTAKSSKRPRRDSHTDTASSGSEAEAEASSTSNSQSPARSPSPTHILVEPISTASDTIPLALIHHIANTHFTSEKQTILTKDALTLLGTYVDTFVREAVTRCAYERADADGEGLGKETVGGQGWLEVADLEKVGVQLVLDF